MIFAAIKLCSMLLTALLVVFSLLIFISSYRKYYNFMKTAHNDKWWELMKRDPLVDAAGEWVRWPIGSIYLLTSIFNKKETYNDKIIETHKNKATLAILTFGISLIAFFVIAVVFPKI